MAIDFPDFPSVDNTYTVGNRTWTWDGSAWNLSSTANNGINLAIASSAPTTPIEGDLWYDTSSGLFYMYYSSAWTQVGGAFDTSIVQDTDQDTYIDTEATTDEDVIRIYTGGTQRLSIGASAMIPETTEVYDLGSSSNRFKDLYLSGTSIDLGGIILTSDGSTLTVPALSVTAGIDADTLEGNAASSFLGLDNAAVSTASTSLNVLRNITLSTSTPTGGSDGDVWMVYS